MSVANKKWAWSMKIFRALCAHYNKNPLSVNPVSAPAELCPCTGFLQRRQCHGLSLRLIADDADEPTPGPSRYLGMTLYKVARLVLKLYVCRFPDEEDIHEDSSGEYDASCFHLSAHTSNIVPRIFQTISHSPQLINLMTQSMVWWLIILYLMLCTNFQKLLMDAVFSISGCLNIHG